MRYIFLLLILVSSVSFAESPVIWDGDYAKSLAVGGFEQDSGKLLYDCLTVDPSAGGGVSAPVGSFCQYGSAGVGKLYIKVGAANTAWSEVSSSSTGWLLVGNAGTSPGTNFIGTTDAQDLQVQTNGLLQMTFDKDGGWASIQNYSLVDNTSQNQYVTTVNANPTANTTAAFARGLSATAIYDSGNTGFNNTGGVSGISPRFEHNGSGTLGFGSIIDGSAYFGANSGTTTLYKGINLDVSITSASVGSYYGISNTANITGATLGNFFGSDFGFSIANSTATGVTGANLNPSVSGTTAVTGSIYGLAASPNMSGTSTVTNGITGISATPSMSGTSVSSANVTGAFISPSLSDSAQATSLIGADVSVNASNTSVLTTGVKGIQVNINSTPDQLAAVGVDIDMSNVDLSPAVLAAGGQKFALNFNDGAINGGYNYTVPGASSFFQQHYIGGAAIVAAADPTAAFGFGTSLAQQVQLHDDWTIDASGLGYVNVGFVGSLAFDAGTTMARWTGALGGAGNPSGAGTLTDAVMFRAGGILPQGGALTVTNMYGFQVDPSLFCLLGTNCWGIYEDTAAVENHLSKLAIGTSTKKVANSDTALEIGNNKAFINGRGTTAQKNALTAVAGMQYFDTDLAVLQWYDGASWVTASSSITTPVSLANGGTAKNMTASAGSVAYSDADSFEFSAVGTSGQALISGGTGAPTWYGPTVGSILFAGTGGILQQDNSNFFWDDTNNRLGIGTASPGYRMHVKMAGATGVDSITWEGSGASASRFWNWMPDSSGFLYMKNLNEAYYSLVFDNVGRAGFGKSSPVSQFHVQPRQANFIVSIFQGYAAQTADLTEWQDSAATVLAKVDSTGKAFFPNLNVSSVTSSLPAKFDASKNITSGAIDLASAEVTGTLPNANTTATSANTASAIVARDASGNFSAGTVTASLSGNASTATALAANPTDCGAGTKATAIDASGNLTCSAVSLTADVSGVLPAANLPAPTTSAIGASDIDWSTLKNVDGLYTKTLSANTTLTFSNVTAGQTIVIAITNTASNYTLAWPAAAKWSGGTTPTQTIGAKTDVYTCKAYDSTNAYCSAVQNF